VSAVDNLEESNLWVTREVNVLSTVSDKLHQSSSHIILYPHLEKNFRKLKLIDLDL